MAIRIVRLGSPRAEEEGLRLGTVRRPPRGVKKEQWASEDFFDVWLPQLAPSQRLVSLAHAAKSEADWKKYQRGYLKEMSEPDTSRLIAMLAALSKSANLSVGCYCDDDNTRCHRWMLRGLLIDAGADVSSG
ncbi:MAG TPA: DUF488 family protein [Thermoanaerobaculia bacterium]|nr:DUF488 family protein [Thermoanaerobaculia bacterium]